MKKVYSALLVASSIFLFSGCSSSPVNAYAVKTADYGQCRSLKKGERIAYKKRPVAFICEDRHVLVGKPYKIEDTWYYKSGLYDGKKVKAASQTKVNKVLRNICQLQGSYGAGTQKIRKFYFDTTLKSCRPFQWSGKGGTAPFDSVDICEMNCHY